ncbi:putative oxidoreductase [Escovopsis weberi]|uniref:Putative oxidoreductase n=1 Tax=Escovopsis weberi TaxID=150374 RepID=A0A0M8N1P9_ESCWE|nr:putative oxidoreductase [Escovopsis weberi]
MSEFKVGVIGYGLSAKVFHIPFINSTPGLRLHAIVQRSPQPGNSAPLDHPHLAAHYTSAAALIADPAVDVVVITATPDTHFELTRQALLADKHVLTEKPFVPTSAEARVLADLARERQRVVCVYQNRRWDADFLLARHLVAAGTLGRVLEVDTHFARYKADAPAGWKAALGVSSAGTVLYDLGAHLIDQAFVLFGAPSAVRGRLIAQRGPGAWETEHPDAVVAELAYDTGLVVNVRISLLSVELDQPRFWIRGDRGSFSSLNLDPQEDQLRDGMAPTDEGYGVLNRDTMRLTVLGDDGVPVRAEVPHLEPETYREFYRKFTHSLRTGNDDDVPVKVEDAIQVLRIIEAIIESAKTGKDVLL